jgi:hypothetical protein
VANQYSDDLPTDEQVLEAFAEHKTRTEAAKALGCHRTYVSKVLARNGRVGGITQSPARDGESPYVVKGVSTYFDAEGNQRGQWVKTRLDDEKREAAIRAAFEAMATKLPRLDPVPAPKATDDKMLNLYTLTDCHVGMLAWHREGGKDWDLAIAENILVGCFAKMIERSPPAATCIVNQLGDFLHYDGLQAMTPTSGHLLDADGRFQKMVEVAVRVLRRIVDMALAKHEAVIVLMAEGNHDLASSVWLRVMFKALYENDPRVVVDDSALPYYAFEHGDTMLAFHHGHLKKPAELPMLFAQQFAPMWGRATKRYGHSGHEHHEEVMEKNGMKWRKHPTLAARDAYAARGGWFAEQAATSFTYHADFGEWGSQTVYPEMLES